MNDVNADHIAGWYVADEPRNASPFSYTPNQVQEVIDAIRQGEQNAGHETLDTYLADEAIHHFNFAPPDNVSNCCYEPVTEYNYPCDVLLLSWYRYYDNNPNVPSEPFGEPPVRTLAAFMDIIPNAAIRKAYDLGIDGIWFYAWRVNSTFEDDAVVNWDTNLNYAEAVENEIHDFDELFTAYANSIYTNSELYLSDIGHGETPLTGQVADYDFSYVTAVSSGDLMGEEGNDTYYLDGKIVYSHPSYSATWYNRSSFPNGDGDDELFSGFLNFFSPSTAYIDGNALNPKNNLRDSSNVVFLASTVGDFDGDGDGELVTAIQDGNTCKIYYSDDGNDIYQYEVYSGTYWRVTAMTTGDFDGKGRDRLVTAFTSPSYTHTAIYLSNPMWGQSPVAGSIYNSRGGVDIHVTALAAGDFDGDYRDELITAFSNQNHNNTIISMCTPDHGGGLGDPNNTVNHIYGPASYYYVTAMTAGDFDGDRTDRLVTAFWNQTYNETAITLCTPNQGGGA